jgi:hypothetical protein
MSRQETLSPDTERFMAAHGKAIDMCAHVDALDVTLTSAVGLVPSDGRTKITATEQPPTLTVTEDLYYDTIGGIAIDRLITVFSLHASGEVMIHEHEERQDDPVDGRLPQRWTGDGPQLLEGDLYEDALSEVYDALDEAHQACASRLIED